MFSTELSLDFDYDDADSLDEEDRARTVYDSRGYIIKAPNLARLSINNLEVQRGTNYFDILLKPLPKLTHLDLSGVAHLEGLGDMSFLNHCPHLASLVLHNVLGIQAAINTIREMKNLR